MNEKKNKKHTLIIAIMLVAIVLITVGGTYAFFITQAGRNEEQKLTVKSGTLALTFEDNDDGLIASMELGKSYSKEFTIRNTGTEAVTTNMIWSGLVNTYLEESLSYTLEYKTTEGGDWQAVRTAHVNVPQIERADDYNLATGLTIPANKTYYYKVTITFNNLSGVNQESDKSAILSTKFRLGEEAKESASFKTLAHLKLDTKENNPTFENSVTTDETAEGLYSMEDDYGTSYYYRGASENNYVKFGKWDEEIFTGQYNSSDSDSVKTYKSLDECQNADSFNYNCKKVVSIGDDMYWRIIRINGDGSIRMIYDGTQVWPNGNGVSKFTESGVNRFTHIGVAWNITNSDDAKYVGWMYGGANGVASTKRDLDGTESSEDEKSKAATYNQTSSNAKTQVDSWYKTNIEDKGFSKYVSDEIFCNDRSLTGNNSTNLGYGSTPTNYAALNRLKRSHPHMMYTYPTFKCSQKNDAFTVSDTTNGNGALTYPVGLITADEAVAGGAWHGKDNLYYYLYKSSTWYYLSSTPRELSSDSSKGASVYTISRLGNLGYVVVAQTGIVYNAEDYYSASSSNISMYGDLLAIAPVINIAPKYATSLIGSGTMESPYQIPGVE